MNTSRFLLLREHFDKLVGLTPSAQQKYINELCNDDSEFAIELRDLLAAHEKPTTLIERRAEVPPSAMSGESLLEEQVRIGPYRLLRLLGSGGMGEVYLAVRDDGAFRKYVALKRIRAEVLSVAKVIERFGAERQVLASLDHPNVARILDGGDTEDGTPYYVMEFIEGAPIDEYCNEKKLDIDKRLRLFQQVVRAVHYLHTCHVVHRDIKPSNILVTADGVPKLLDFGIAKILGPIAPDLTGVYGTPMTPQFASPEQLAGRSVTAASDIYSLGIVLYLLLTGSHPDPLKLVPPSAVAASGNRMPEGDIQLKRKMSGDLDQVVLKALQRDPSDRYRTAEEFAEDLGRYLDHRTVIARKATVVERTAKFIGRNRLAVAIAVLITVLATSAGWFGHRSFRTQSELNRLNASARQLTALKSTRDLEQIFRNLTRLGETLANPLLQADNLNEQQLQIRQSILRRSGEYLEKLDPLSQNNPSLAKETGNVYLRIAEIQQSKNRPKLADQAAAVANYTAAARQFARVVNSDPQNQEIRERLTDVERRLTLLEATVPPEVVVILHPQATAQKEQKSPLKSVPLAGILKTRSTSRKMIAPVTASEPSPATAVPPVESAGPPAPAELLDLQIQVQSRVDTAEQRYQELKATLQRQGLAVRPQTIAMYNSMKYRIANAIQQIQQRDFSGAKDSLTIAGEYAQRLLENR